MIRYAVLAMTLKTGVSLERLFRSFSSCVGQRHTWRQGSDDCYRNLLARGHEGRPALVPGLVHARLATALLAGRYRQKRQLQGRTFLCLGCHAGLEVRTLRDLGAKWAHLVVQLFLIPYPRYHGLAEELDLT